MIVRTLQFIESQFRSNVIHFLAGIDGKTLEEDAKEKARRKEEKRQKAEKRKAAKEAKAKAKADKEKRKEADPSNAVAEKIS